MGSLKFVFIWVLFIAVSLDYVNIHLFQHWVFDAFSSISLISAVCLTGSGIYLIMDENGKEMPARECGVGN